MTTIYQLDTADRVFLGAYSAVDRTGAVFADDDCVELRPEWRKIASGELAKWGRRHLVLCLSPDGFSLHAPNSTDNDIASGDAPYIVSEEGRPTDCDYAEAAAKHLAAEAE